MTIKLIFLSSNYFLILIALNYSIKHDNGTLISRSIELPHPSSKQFNLGFDVSGRDEAK